MSSTIRRAILCSSAIFMPSEVFAQDAPPAAETPPPVATTAGDKQTYTPADFERFAPRNALDMVNQIPGFVIDQGDEERRGLGQATQNVLINGKRISGKSNDAITELTRINAKDVVRIEVADGATLDIPGLSGQVVNIVTAVKGMTGTFRWSPQFREKRTKPSWLNGEVSISGKTGKFDYSLSLSDTQRRNGNAGLETVTDGVNIIDLRDEILFVNQDSPKIAGSLKYQGDNGDIGNLNGSIQKFKGVVDEQSYRSFPGTVDRHRDYRETEREWNYEVGGDYEFGFAGGRLKLIGLRRFEHSPFVTRSVFDYGDGRPDTGDLFLRTVDEGETIARAEYRWKGGGADWQISAEGALNTLDNRSELSTLDAGGVFQPVPLPGGNAMVKEKRAELMFSYGRPLSKNLTLQSAIGGEYSNITQEGAGGLNRTFYRPKGFVSLAWKPSPRFDLSAKIEREVGQLNFYDFVASVNLAGGGGNAGNPDLRPFQSWNLSLEANRSLGAWGSVKAKAYGKWITDAPGQIPVGVDGEAPGNIDKARQYGVSISGTLNFDPLGWKGAKLNFNAARNWSSLADPLTGINRPFSESTRYEYGLNFRHDLAGSSWAWGVDYYEFKLEPGVRLDQISYILNAPGELGAFVENKDVFGLTVRGGVFNFLGINERFARTVYQNGRRTNPIAFTEDRSRYFGLIFSLQVSGSF